MPSEEEQKLLISSLFATQADVPGISAGAIDDDDDEAAMVFVRLSKTLTDITIGVG